MPETNTQQSSEVPRSSAFVSRNTISLMREYTLRVSATPAARRYSHAGPGKRASGPNPPPHIASQHPCWAQPHSLMSATVCETDPSIQLIPMLPDGYRLCDRSPSSSIPNSGGDVRSLPTCLGGRCEVDLAADRPCALSGRWTRAARSRPQEQVVDYAFLPGAAVICSSEEAAIGLGRHSRWASGETTQ